MADLLDRQAVIDLFDKYHPYMGTRVLEYERKLKELPTVNAVPVDTLLVQTIESITKASEAIMNSPLKYIVKEEHDDDLQPNWIPVTERLPKDMEFVLCYCRGNQYMILRQHNGDSWFEDIHDLNPNGLCRAYMKAFVIAWMPLPEPYERKEE